jgi:hypothetical protein
VLTIGNGDFIGLRIVGATKRVLVINLEGDADEMTRRRDAALAHFKIDPSELGDRLYFYNNDDNEDGFKIMRRNGRVLIKVRDLQHLSHVDQCAQVLRRDA